MNKVLEVGRLTRDPELRYTPSGVAVCNFVIAVNREYKSEKTDTHKPDFLSVVAWRKQAEAVVNNLKKGRKIFVEGKLEVSTYNAEDGSKRSVTNIVADSIEFLDYPKKDIGSTEQEDPSVNIPEEELTF